MSSHQDGKVECPHPDEYIFVNGRGELTCEKCGCFLKTKLYNQRDIDETGYQNDGMYPSGRF